MEKECGSGVGGVKPEAVSSEKNGGFVAKSNAGLSAQKIGSESGRGVCLEKPVSCDARCRSSSDSEVGGDLQNLKILAENADGICDFGVDSGLLFEKSTNKGDLLECNDDPSTRPVVVNPSEQSFGTPTPEKFEKPVVVSDCQTPIESLFDPFAPAPEELVMFAPKKRFWRQGRGPLQRRIDFDSCSEEKEPVGFVFESDMEEKRMKIIESLSRRLDFDAFCDTLAMSEGTLAKKIEPLVVSTASDCMIDSGVDSEVINEEEYLESVYKSFLDVIVATQMETTSDVDLLANSDIPDGLKTPTDLPLLTGIAETCPPAPIRPPAKSRAISISICRKLDFEQPLD